jgi:drug/metabolite transporter (DMT)-like permease
MIELAVGAVAAVTASALFSAGLLIQAREARSASETSTLGLFRHPRWILGGVVMLVGFVFHVAALALAPLTVVQPALAAGLVVLLLAASRETTERATPRELAGVAAIGIGVVGVTLAASDETADTASALALALVLGALGVIAIAPLRQRGITNGWRATIGAGAAYSLTGITTSLMSDRITSQDTTGALLWLAATGAVAVLALLDQTAALRRRNATQVGVAIYVMPVVVPVLLSPLLTGEEWSDSPLGVVALAVSLGAVCLGAAALASSPRIAERGLEGHGAL